MDKLWLYEGKLNVDLKFSHALARAPVMREIFGAKVDERHVVITEEAIYLSKVSLSHSLTLSLFSLYTHAHTVLYIYISTYIHAYMHACMHTYIHT